MWFEADGHCGRGLQPATSKLCLEERAELVRRAKEMGRASKEKEQHVQRPGGEQWQVRAGVGKGPDDIGSGLQDNEVWALKGFSQDKICTSFFL